MNSETTARLTWGILGTGMIARRFAKGVQASSSGVLAAVGSRAAGTAEAFGAEFDIPHRHGSYEALLADSGVAAVYVSTPHPMHARWTLLAIEAGKHVLVEKPMAMNWAEAMAMVDAARAADVFLMEAFMYRCHPQMRRLRELIAERIIGDVQLVTASFAYRTDAGPDSRFFSQELGGGGILDVGCYPVSLARLVAGAAHGKLFADPIDVKGVGHLGSTGTDDWAISALRFEGDIVAQCSTGLRLNMHEDTNAKIYGSEGTIFLPSPWAPGIFSTLPAKLIVKRHDEKQPREVIAEGMGDLYTYQADTVAAHIRDRQSPAMSWDDSLGNMRALDRWRAELGLVYELEKPANITRTLTGRPLAVKRDAPMTYGGIAGLDKKIARLVFGCDSNNTMPETAVLLDDYFAQGGNAFDVSYGYGTPNGAPERHLGQWIRRRGVRDQVVVIEKGANAPNDHPGGLSRELLAGLERLAMDRVDIYMIHRDNEQIPIGEWVDVLDEHLKAGRMTVFGLSNFSLERLKAFVEYAAKNGRTGFSCVSNQFSLARLQAPPWNMHLVSSSDAQWRRWFTQTQTPLMAWSSQSRGFFTRRAGPEKTTDAELVRCWYSPDNFQRRQRAEQLAQQRGVELINIALAYVLNQPFPTFPLFGPKRIAETHSSLRALTVRLTAEELRWLDLETDAPPPGE